MAQFAVPSRPASTVLTVDRFLGCNFTDHPTAVDPSMSPWAPNMVRDVPGKVRKSMGWQVVEQYQDRINGVHRLSEGETLIHAGTKLYQNGVEIFGGMADEKSRSWQIAQILYISDKNSLLAWDGETVSAVGGIATVPVLTIGKSPEGGGTPYEDLNLLQPKFTELFAATATAKTFQLSFGGLDQTAVTAKKLTAQGVWQELTEGSEFSVNRTAGTITFVAAPGASPITGEDNVSITAARTVAGYADRVQKCTVGILYGINGSPNRLFLGGGPMEGRDWYSAENDGSYFADTAYCIPAAAQSRVVGYSVVADKLATHLANSENDRNIVLREGKLLDKKAVFAVTGSLKGPAAIAPGSFATLAGEPVFLTAQGIFALTPDDVTGERYAQNRSYYLNGRLLQLSGLADAQTVSFQDYYLLCVGDEGYLLDGLQPLPAAKGEPYSERQYVGFLRQNLPARVLWTEEGRLWFGTEDGRVCRFFDDPELKDSYADDGQAICARWETPQLSGTRFFTKKNFRMAAVRLAAAAVTSVAVYASRDGVEKQVFSDTTHARYFSWSNLSWSNFVWGGDAGARLIKVKLRMRRVNKTRLALENAHINEPFGLYELALIWRENTQAD